MENTENDSNPQITSPFTGNEIGRFMVEVNGVPTHIAKLDTYDFEFIISLMVAIAETHTGAPLSAFIASHRKIVGATVLDAMDKLKKDIDNDR